METVEDLFERWYVRPLRRLQEIPNGDGGFIVLATSCFLYERYAVAVICESGAKVDRKAIVRQFAADFGVDEKTVQFFWDVIRDGLSHSGMPKGQEHGQPMPKWAFREDFPAVELSEWDSEQVLKVQPWRIREKVISLWKQNLHLLAQSKSFPWANVVPLPL